MLLSLSYPFFCVLTFVVPEEVQRPEPQVLPLVKEHVLHGGVRQFPWKIKEDECAEGLDKCQPFLHRPGVSVPVNLVKYVVWTNVEIHVGALVGRYMFTSGDCEVLRVAIRQFKRLQVYSWLLHLFAATHKHIHTIANNCETYRCIYLLDYYTCNVVTHTHTHSHTLNPRLFKDVFIAYVLIIFQPLLGAVLVHSVCCNTHTLYQPLPGAVLLQSLHMYGRTRVLVVFQPLLGAVLILSLCCYTQQQHISLRCKTFH